MRTLTLLIALISMATVGCGQDNPSAAEEAAPSSGPVKIDGSSTVFPFAKAVAGKLEVNHGFKLLKYRPPLNARVNKAELSQEPAACGKGPHARQRSYDSEGI